jgi:hypothetical protein
MLCITAGLLRRELCNAKLVSMADQTSPSFGDSRDLLASSRALTQRVRDAQRGAWFPLALFGLATLASAPVDRYGTTTSCSNPGGRAHVCLIYSRWELVYWPAVLVLIYIAVAAFYARRSRQRGVGTRVQPYVVAGIVIAIVLSAVSIWIVTRPSASVATFGLHLQPGTPLDTAALRLISPAAAIGLALLVLARIERNVALLVFTLAYLAIVLFEYSARHSPVMPHPSPWFFLPRLFTEGAVLLLGSLGFTLAGRHSRWSAR